MENTGTNTQQRRAMMMLVEDLNAMRMDSNITGTGDADLFAIQMDVMVPSLSYLLSSGGISQREFSQAYRIIEKIGRRYESLN